MKKLKKKYVISLISIIVPIIIVLLIMNGGYSMWTSKLNIAGRVTLEKKETKLEVSPIAIEGGRYINYSGFSNGETVYFKWNGDSIDENSLSSNISVENANNNKAVDFSISFTLKNNSSDGVSYTGGTIIQDKKVDSGNAIKSSSYTLSNSELNSGDSTTVKLNYSVQRKSINSGTYIRYIIKYDTQGTVEPVPYYYYYTIYISP